MTSVARDLHLVTGAPGAGKSTALAAFLASGHPAIAFDMDWLIDAASALSGRPIRTDPPTWPSYNALWLEIIHAVARNGRGAVLFTPIHPRDLDGSPHPFAAIRWLLLDCPDDVRRSRLARRPDWTDDMIDAAVSDAADLRDAIGTTVDTATHGPDAVADAIAGWLPPRT